MTLQKNTCVCGKTYYHYGDAVSCPYCFRAVSQPVKAQNAAPEPVAMTPEQKALFKKTFPSLAKEPLYRQAKRKARRTEGQRRAAQNMSDALQRAKSDMIRHVIDKVNAGYYTVFAFLADPSAYFDGAVMGKWVNNPFLRRSVVTAVKNHYAVEAPF